MKIKEIIHNGDYEVVIANEYVEILCNSLSKPIADDVRTLYCFMSNNILFSNVNSFELLKDKMGYFSYKIYAKIKDISNKIVEFYDLTLILDCPIPRDLENGQFIEFYVLRLDIYA